MGHTVKHELYCKNTGRTVKDIIHRKKTGGTVKTELHLETRVTLLKMGHMVEIESH